MEQYKYLFQEAERIAVQQHSKYKNTQNCKGDLLEFLDINEWFGIQPTIVDGEIMIIPTTAWKEAVSFWLTGYKKKASEKLELLLQKYIHDYPDLCIKYRKFVSKKDIWSKPAAWKVFDYILSSISQESDLKDEALVKKLMEKSIDILSKEGGYILWEFLKSLNKSSPWEYYFEKRKIDPSKNYAYSVQEFSKMAYCIFNDQFRMENNLVEKACKDERYANIWLYTALHFVCALRQTDMKRLPLFTLAEPGENVRMKILSGEFCEYSEIIEKWLFLIQMKPQTPQKTKRYSGISNLKIFIPESIKDILGIILTIVLTYKRAGDELVSPTNSFLLYKNFFGTVFLEACENRRFSSRRANKAFLQGIEMIGNNEGRIQGYMLASLARSHKGAIGELSKITDLYLRDAEFTGYNPEFILRELFDRGIFGFIPAMLIEMMYGDDYKQLTIHNKTQVIQRLGLSATQINQIMAQVDLSLVKAQKVINELLTSETDISQILLKIANNQAGGKQEDILCLRAACGEKCILPNSNGCIGCGYEIYTKAAFFLLVKQYVRLSEKMKASANKDFRYQKMLQKVIIPKIQEILESMELLYPEMDKSFYFNTLERGVVYVDSCEYRTDGGLIQTKKD